MSETVKVYWGSDKTQLNADAGGDWRWWHTHYGPHNEKEVYHFCEDTFSKPMMHALIDNREAIEKLLETAKAVEVKLEDGPLFCPETGGLCAGIPPKVTLTPIPADPWPADAVEVWKVTRGEEVQYVWKMRVDDRPWRGIYSNLHYYFPTGTLPDGWCDEPWNLVWERVR